ncbi:MAG: DNA polymerase-like protein [Mesorhizobium sp.]|nr:MAG: DNA polymerase-like protein [Mesorhizobium sp.]RWP80276.1 MAG: DNA polymerase-like protein [Mesorhizobium sp.]
MCRKSDLQSFSSQASVTKIGVPPNRRRTVTCQDAMQARGRSWLEAAGLVLVRQRPAKGFMFLTMEDETGAANVVVWVKIFEKFRRVLLASAMLGVRGRIQREEEVVHLVAHELTDLSAGLASVGNRKTPFPLPHGRGTRPITADRASIRAACRRGATSSMQYDHIDHIKVKTRDFR